MQFRNPEQPILGILKGQTLDNIGMIEFLQDIPFVLDLLLEFVILLGIVDRNNLQGIGFLVQIASDVEDDTVGPGTQSAKDFETAYFHVPIPFYLLMKEQRSNPTQFGAPGSGIPCQNFLNKTAFGGQQ